MPKMHGNVNLLPEEEEAHGWETANNYFPRRRNAASAIKCRRKIDLSDKDLAKPMPFVGRRDNGGEFCKNVLMECHHQKCPFFCLKLSRP